MGLFNASNDPRPYDPAFAAQVNALARQGLTADQLTAATLDPTKNDPHSPHAAAMYLLIKSGMDPLAANTWWGYHQGAYTDQGGQLAEKKSFVDSPWGKLALLAPMVAGGGIAAANAIGGGGAAAAGGAAGKAGSGEPNWDTYGDQWWYDENGNIVGDAGIGTGHGVGQGGPSEGSSVSGPAGGAGSAIGNALKKALPALIAGGVGLGGRALAGGGFGSGVPPPPPIPPELQQLLAQAMQRVGAQQPIVNAVNKQTLAGLPAYAQKG